jgi:hypothetical protein
MVIVSTPVDNTDVARRRTKTDEDIGERAERCVEKRVDESRYELYIARARMKWIYNE